MSHILIAEDDELLRALLASTLGERGHSVDQATTGFEALVRIQQRRPDLIILDLMMPVLNGWQFVEELRRQPGGADIPIIVISAVRSLFDETATLPVGVVMSKPFDIDVLLRHVDRLTGAAT